MVLRTLLASARRPSITGLSEAFGEMSLLSLSKLRSLLRAFWFWSSGRRHPPKASVPQISHHVESDNDAIKDAGSQSHDFVSESAREVQGVDPSSKQGKKKNRRGGRSRKGPASGSSTASTALPDSMSDVAEMEHVEEIDIGQAEVTEKEMLQCHDHDGLSEKEVCQGQSEGIAVGQAEVAETVTIHDDVGTSGEGWNAAPTKKQRNKAKRKTKAERLQQKAAEPADEAEENQFQRADSAAPVVQEDDQCCATRSARAPQCFEEDLSDDGGDLSDLYYSQKGSRHNFRTGRKDKQRNNYKDVAKVALIRETRMKQSAMDRGLIPRESLKQVQ
eukprot:gnl/MRDRNA2_/MRDRNA2_29522_c0_seq1.p1 gnl/MRDRNA2_/MRDRNA2_29522_c0~~gnl/MRDRNA2_/MRDRNA2_29522_c0_seq1.p1  ORF type:complete len:332 (+),score=77.15 gnl/MRDRNA2_/MRDRNA2_29522_c0_seq1:105-1100(+)